MSFRRIRVLVGLSAGIGFVFGFGAGWLDVPERAMLPLLLAFMLVVGGACYLYVRRLKQTGRFDERHTRIQRRASKAAYGTLLLALIVTASVVTFGGVDVPIVPTMWGLVIGGSLLDQVFIEWFRRRM